MSDVLPIPKKNSFVGDLFKLISGTVIAQLVIVLASPVLTRLFTPEAFGIFSVFSSIVGVLASIICLRYEYSIMLPESDEVAANLFIGSLLISGIISILFIPVFMLFGDLMATILNSSNLSDLIWLIPVVLLFGGVSVGHPALNYWATRKKRYKELSILKVIVSLVIITTQLGFGLLGFTSAHGLVIGGVLGSVISPLILAIHIWREDKNLLLLNVNFKSILTGLARYKNFPLYSTWAVLLNTISWQLPVFLLSLFFSPEISGLYSIGFRLFQVPMSLIGSSYAQVFFKNASEAKAEGELALVVKQTYSNLVRLGLFPFLVFTIIGRELFIFVFGSQWSEAGVYAQILGIWAFVWFVSSPITILYSLLEKQDLALKMNILILGTRFISLIIGGWFESPRISIWLFSLTGLAVYGFQNFLLMKLSGVESRYIINTLAHSFMKFIPSGIVLTGLLLIHLDSWLYTCLGALFVLLYYIALFKESEDLQKFVSHLISKMPVVFKNKQ